jgi:hypothetical protein
MSVLRVRYTRFWEGFDPEDNFLSHLIERQGFTLEIVRNEQESCDVEFVSVYATNKEQLFQMFSIIRHRILGSFKDVEEKYRLLNVPKTRNAKRRIWVTGENLRPPYTQEFDGYLSYDQNLLRNCAYLPVWYFDAGFFKSHFVSRVGVETSTEMLLKRRDINKVPPKFACMFVANPHSVRLHFADLLAQYGNVEKFGSAFGNRVEHKFPLGSEFKFTIAFENDFYPGYVTEKILEAYLCKSIPVYWGGLSATSPINPEAVIVMQEGQSLENLAQKIANFTDSEILEKLNQPLLRFLPDTSDIAKIIFGN